MKKVVLKTLFLPGRALWGLLLLVLLSGSGVARAGGAAAGFGLAQVAVDYCFTTADYAVLAETVGPNVNFTFHPLGATAGGNLAILYLREGPTGAYPGYTMAKNAAGDFTFVIDPDLSAGNDGGGAGGTCDMFKAPLFGFRPS